MKISIVYDYNDIKNSRYLEKVNGLKKEIRQCIRMCLKQEGIKCDIVEVYFKYTLNGDIQKINNEFRKINKPTDVLSFPMYEKEDLLNEVNNNIKSDIVIPFTLGDIVISVEKVEEQSKEYGHSFKRELIYLTTHSMFHLLGYDHMEESQKKVMRQKENNIMNILNINK